jgi:fumarate reductase flavoprotein subunit
MPESHSADVVSADVASADVASADVVSADVVIAGGGMAGLAALLTAVEAGADALLLERGNDLGGSTVLSSGLLAFAGTAEQAAAGITDSADLLRRDLLTAGRDRNCAELVEAYCEHQLDTYRWLAARGTVFGHPHAASGQSVPRSHPIDTNAAIQGLAKRARAAGGRIVVAARARRLLTEGGRVTGVAADSGDGRLEVRAAATVLATGGFSRSGELMTRFAPGMGKALRHGGAGSTGDGLLMACKLGAGLADLPYVKGTFGIFPWPSAGEEGTGILAVYKGAIAVNGFGMRFVNESLPYKEIGDACLAQPGEIAFQVFDAAVLAASDAGVPIYDFRKRITNRQVQQADTIAGLADKLGVPPGSLAKTVTEYNARITVGQPDPLGRETLSGGVGTPVPLVTPPFYGFPSATVVLATYAGITIDGNARVLDVYGDPVPGLYAAGEVTGGLHGAGYVTGTSIGKSAIFGRLAGAAAVELAHKASA